MKFFLAAIMLLALGAVAFGDDPRIGSNTSGIIAAVVVTPGDNATVGVKLESGYQPTWRIDFATCAVTFDGDRVRSASDLANRCGKAEYVRGEFTGTPGRNDWIPSAVVFASGKRPRPAPIDAVAPAGMTAIPPATGSPLVQGRCSGGSCESSGQSSGRWEPFGGKFRVRK